MTGASMWDELCDVLLDLDFLQTRMGALSAEKETAAVGVSDVLRDYLAALQELPVRQRDRDTIEKLYDALGSNGHILWEYPRLLLQQVSNACDWEGTKLGDQINAAIRVSPWPLLRLLRQPAGEEHSALLRTLACHTDYVTSVAFRPNGVFSVAFSPDGKRLASGSGDGTVKVWDAQTGQETLTLKGHNSPVNSVAFSPDGKRLASGSNDETVKVWDAQTGQEALTLKGHTSLVLSVCFSPDGKRLASGSDDKTVKVWDAQTGQQALSLKGHTNWVNSVCFSPDGKRLLSASGGYDPKTRKGLGELKVWDAQTGQQVLSLTGHTGPVTSSVAFSPDGRRIASGSLDKTVKVWDAQTGLEALSLTGHTFGVTSLVFNSDGRSVASGDDSEDDIGTVCLWDVTAGALIAWRQFEGTIRAIWFHPDGSQLSFADDGGRTGRPRVYVLEVIRPSR